MRLRQPPPMDPEMTTTTVCLIAKNEAPYLVEWIAHYLALGFDKLVIYDNGSIDSMARIIETCADLEPGIEFRPWPDRPGHAAQNTAYADALARADTDWIAFFDADELLVLNLHDSIQEFLDRYPANAGAIGINWVMFGSGGETSYRKELQAVRFRMCSFDSHIKTIARVSVATPPPYPIPIAHRVGLREGVYYTDTVEELVFSERPANSETTSFECAQLHHYLLRSAEEFRWKIERGLATRVPGDKNCVRDQTYWERNERNKIVREETARIDRWTAAAAPRRARFEAALAERGITAEPYGLSDPQAMPLQRRSVAIPARDGSS